MSILARFKDIMASNVDAPLNKMEDPAKMVDQYLLNMAKDLAGVKKETANIGHPLKAQHLTTNGSNNQSRKSPKSPDPYDKVQAYRDSGVRNTIEGIFGIGKMAYGLNRVRQS